MTNKAGLEWLICREPVHIGGADSSSRGNNNPVFRLPDNSPAIPGSSLRGALRESATTSSNYPNFVENWFGGDRDNPSPGYLGLSWGWPVWWPIHVLGYGNWWVSCPTWINRCQQLRGEDVLSFDSETVYVTAQELHEQTVYLRWLKLTNVEHWPGELPTPTEIPAKRRIVVPDDSINLLVEMGLVRQPRVSLKDYDELLNNASANGNLENQNVQNNDNNNDDENGDDGSLVKNLFAVEGLPPGAVFLFAWTTRGHAENLDQWSKFLHQEHYLGGLWSVGYGRIEIKAMAPTPVSTPT